MQNLTRTSIFRERLPIEQSLTNIDLDDLRQRFMPLFDRAAQAIQVAGYEQDDGLIVRRLVCATNGGFEHVIEADALCDANRFVAQITHEVGSAAGRALEPADITITALEVETFLERWA